MALRIYNVSNFKTINTISSKCMSTVSSTYDYQYIQKSKVPTMHFQKSLPRLPVPKLNDTCNKYLAAQRPILTNEQYQVTERLTKEFEEGEGKTLQELLVAKDKSNKHTSYISEPWFDMYLRDRTPLPINYNPAIIFQDDQKPNYSSQVLKSTNMVISSLRFMKSLRRNILEPEVFHISPKKSDSNAFRVITSLLPSSISWYGAYMFNAYPLDMSQYFRLFNSTRIPCMGKDKLFQDVEAKHVVVMKGGNFYMFDVLDNSGAILPAREIFARLKQVADDVSPSAEIPLGVLTAENRDTWCKVREHMVNMCFENQDFFKKVDSALFTLILDDEHLGQDNVKTIRHFLHGDGKNRWFDKSFSLIVSKDGVAGLNFEHSWGDGVAVLRYFQDIYKDSINNPQIHPDTEPVQLNRQVQKLGFKTDDFVKKAVTNAIKNYSRVIDSLDVNFFVSNGIGKKICKKLNLSPDSLMQLGFQDAFYKENNTFVASYESCSTAAFKHGRTETIRPCTTATKEYCLAANQTANKADLLKLIQNCSDVHKKLTRDAAMGQGFDRHLFALKLTADENNMNTPDIFKDEAYELINKNVISTSTLNSPAIKGGGFGPVVPHGYGIAYMIQDDQLGTVVTNNREQRDGSHFVECIQRSFKQLRDILS